MKNETLERIISHSQLKLRNEDQLVKFINFLYATAGEVKSEYSKLYGYVIFTNVSSSAIGEFLDEIGKDDLTEEAWNSISHRLRQAIPKNQQTEQPGRYRGKMFLPRGERNFEGIISHLQRESNGKISEKVEITASPVNGGNSIVNVTHFDKDDYYKSTDVAGSWICFDFKKSRVVPTNYQIKSYPSGPSSDHPKTWVIEGKTDEISQWENIGGESDCAYLNAGSVSHVFALTNENGKEFRYIRMRQTGPNWHDQHHLRIGSFELYGSLID